MQRITIGQIDFNNYYEYADTKEEFLEQVEEELDEFEDKLRSIYVNMNWEEYSVLSELKTNWVMGEF